MVPNPQDTNGPDSLLSNLPWPIAVWNLVSPRIMRMRARVDRPPKHWALPRPHQQPTGLPSHSTFVGMVLRPPTTKKQARPSQGLPDQSRPCFQIREHPGWETRQTFSQSCWGCTGRFFPRPPPRSQHWTWGGGGGAAKVRS